MSSKTPVWDRVIEVVKAERVSKPDDAPRWLYTALGYTKQRTANWGARDIPAREYVSVAGVIGRSIAWVSTGTARRVRAFFRPRVCPR